MSNSESASPTDTQFAVAVHVLAYLAGVGDSGPVPSPELAGGVDTSPEYVRRVMIPLRASGLVRSSTGKRGGWSLARASSSITIADLLDPVGSSIGHRR